MIHDSPKCISLELNWKRFFKFKLIVNEINFSDVILVWIQKTKYQCMKVLKYRFKWFTTIQTLFSYHYIGRSSSIQVDCKRNHFSDLILVCKQKTKYQLKQLRHEICRKYIKVELNDPKLSKIHLCTPCAKLI